MRNQQLNAEYPGFDPASWMGRYCDVSGWFHMYQYIPPTEFAEFNRLMAEARAAVEAYDAR